jgi:phenylalanyl-tRNA synthetase beta chain
MSWLRDCVDAVKSENLPAFMDRITQTGTKVEGLTLPGEEITGVVTGRVLSVEKHPDADKLLITKIDIGEKTIQIITGATNLTVGAYVPVALDGAKLAEGKRIKKGKLRGLDSEGMLCDIGELGRTRYDYPEAPENGIYIFQEPQPLGADVRPLLQLTDEVIDFEIMSNRPDCNSIIGVAREAAAAYGQTFTPPEISLKETAGGDAAEMISVEIKNPALCPRYIARVVKNVKVGPSPLWLRHRLTACGLRPINNIVDITNYVMLEYGQPMHAFDIDNIAEGRIIVRNAAAGEKFTTLDGVERTLDETMLVIADPQKAVAAAGVMGGENSMVTGNASAVLFESATFNGPNIRFTSRKLGLRTDASARYEKGLDPNLALDAVNRAMQLIEELECGEVVPGIAEAYPEPRLPFKVGYNPASVSALIGADISAGEMVNILSRIGIETENEGGETRAVVPTRRRDISREADIAEEVARFYGYGNIPSRETQTVAAPGGRSEKQRFADKIHSAMVALGYCEALTYPFESPKVFDRLALAQDDPLRNAIRIQNPLGEDFSVMRTVTLNGLLESLALNFNRKNEYARLYELAYAYIPKSLPLTELPEERFTLTFAEYDKKGTDFFDIKGGLEELLWALGLDGSRVKFEASARYPYMHPGRAADIFICEKGGRNPKLVGYAGEIHPAVCHNYQLGERAYAGVLDLECLFTFSAGVKRVFKPLPKFPSIQRDIALRVKTEITAAQVEAAIKEKGSQLLAGIKLFDVYQGVQVEEGYKSMAYSLSFRSPDRTLTEADIDKPMKNILENLSKKLDAALRGLQ